MNINLLNNEYFAKWNEYVDQHPEATICQRAEWKMVLEQVYGFDTYYFFVEENGVIKGILPLARAKTLFFGDNLISTPFCVYGGVCADNDEIKSLLRKKAIAQAKELKLGYVELRDSVLGNDNWHVKEHYYTFRKEIDSDPDVNMKNIPRKQRAMIRKGIDAGLESRINNNVDDFYRVYSVNMRNLGTPVYPKKYFQTLMKVFADNCNILMVYKNDVAISGVFSFYFRNTVLPYYGGGLPDARRFKAYDFMYWELMQNACARGISCFDFGRSIIGAGSFSFKKNWGFEPERLYYQQYMINAKESPDISPLDKKYQRYIAVWKRLPLFLANKIGPIISKGLG